jgi:hypothetical protein
MRYKARDFFKDWDKRVLRDDVAEIYAGMDRLEVKFKDPTKMPILAVRIGFDSEGNAIYSDNILEILAYIIDTLDKLMLMR